MPTKHALLIGVDEYPDFPPDSQLKACVADAKLMKSVLVERFKFDESNVVELHNTAASRQGILDAMDHLVDSIEQDDIVVFHFSGHGARSVNPTADVDEGSGRDSTICPADTGYMPPSPNLDIIDNEINDWLVRLTRKTRYVSLTFDCCHSGTITRNIFGGKARGISVAGRSLPVGRLANNTSSSNHHMATTRGTGASNAANIVQSGLGLMLNDNFVVMSGCRDDEESNEFYREQNGETIRHGALTYYLSKALLEAKPGSSYRDVFEIARQGVNAKFSRQHPQIEGVQDREIFGVNDIEALRYIAVQSVDGKQITLAGGAAHGLNVGAIWTVYPQGTKQTEGTSSLGEIRITQLGSLSSQGVLVDGTSNANANISIGDRCVETAISAEQYLLSVDLHQLGDSDAEQLKQQIEGSRLLRLAANPGTGDYVAFVLQPGDSSQMGLNLPPAIHISTPTWAVLDNTGAFAMPPRAKSDQEALGIIVSNLEVLARYRNALSLNNPDSKLNVEFNVYHRDDDDKLHKINNQDFVFEEGQSLGFEIINHQQKKVDDQNNVLESGNVYVSVFDFGMTGKVQVVYPNRKSAEQIAPGKSIKIGTEPNTGRIQLSILPEFVGEQGSSAIKVIVTSEESDFQWLQQEGTRSVEQKPFALREQFEAAFNGPSTRFIPNPFKKKKANKEADWIAIAHSFQIRRKGH